MDLLEPIKAKHHISYADLYQVSPQPRALNRAISSPPLLYPPSSPFSPTS